MNEELKVIISAEIGKLKDGVKNAQKQIESFSDKVKKAKGNVSQHFAKIGESVKKGLKIGATAIAGAATALVALGESTKEYRQAQEQLTTAFQTAGANAETAKQTYNDLFRVLGDSGQATEAANHLAKMTTSEKELSEWTNICQGVYATFSDSLPIESLTEAANETAKVGQITGSLADALNWAGVNEDEFNEKLAKCNSEAEREKLIRETLNGLYSEASANYETNNAKILEQNEAQTKLNEAMGQLGEAMTPVNTLLAELGTEVLTAISPYLQSFSENYLPIIQEKMIELKDSLSQALEFMKEHKLILEVLAGIITGVVVAIGLYNAVQAIKTAMDVAQVSTLGALIVAQLASAAATMAAIAPYLLIVAAIAGVIAIIVLCVKHWDEIKEKIYEVAEKIKTKVEELKESLSEKFQTMKENIIAPFREAKENAIETFENIKNKITEKVENTKNKIKSIVDKIKGFFNFEATTPKIKIPHFAVSPKGWKVKDLLEGQIPKLSIDWYAKGGVFDKPTLFAYGNGSIGGLGEAGVEAVVPLEKNTKWLDKIAERLSGNGSPIILQVDGKTFAEVAVDCINGLTKQSGTLPLVLG